MTIRFAAARKGHNAIVTRSLRVSLPARAANDNAFGLSGDRVLRAALRHFAEHGLSAAEHARRNAEKAFFAGDRQGYRWWLSICFTLDRRMGDAVDAHTRAANDSAANNAVAENPAGTLA